jgi:S-adenosylmethionine-dependent methyltransferase
MGRLRRDLTVRYLLRHTKASPACLEVLDVGGGTGSYALPLAQLGHRVRLLDFSPQMLDIARARATQLGPPVAERIEFCKASAQDTASLFPPDRFDLILCHTLLEYVSDHQEVFQVLISVLRPGGLLSLLTVNAYADPLRLAIARQDLHGAHLALQEQVSPADLFGLPRQTFATEAMHEALDQAGLDVVAEYGVRIFSDYMPAERLGDPEFLDRLLELETVAGALHPYKLIARYNHFLARKPGSG